MNYRPDLAKAAFCSGSSVVRIAVVLLLCFAILPQCYAQQPRNRSVVPPPVIVKTGGVDDPQVRQIPPLPPPGLAPDTSKTKIRPPEVAPEEPIVMQFDLQWTNYRIHRANDFSPIEITLSGSITTSSALVWNLAPTCPPGGGSPQLVFNEDIFGSGGSLYGADIPVSWEISIDGGPFVPMTVMPNSSLSAIFPFGSHTFQVRMTATPEYHQADGYYELHLTQSLMPQF